MPLRRSGVRIRGCDSTPPTVDELIGLHRPDEPAISPDGHFVAYTVRQPNWADNTYETQVWLANSETDSLIQLTNSKGTTFGPTWSPDGRWLGIVSDRDGTWQVYIISPTGREARKITTSATGVLEFRWSPDGKRIAFTAPDPESEQIKRRKEKYSDFEVVRHEARRNGNTQRAHGRAARTIGTVVPRTNAATPMPRTWRPRPSAQSLPTSHLAATAIHGQAPWDAFAPTPSGSMTCWATLWPGRRTAIRTVTMAPRLTGPHACFASGR
jgi:dipeptidyl aminopeptidase/acylaminoacyl peptidase